jgi:heme exporter protein A
LLKVENLSCQRSNDLIFKNLSFEVVKGENLEIIGSNGSGKTSLLKCILGLIEKKRGQISWNQRPLEESRTLFLKSCYYQGHQLALKNNFSVLENLKFSHLAFNADKKKIMSSLKVVGMAEFVHRSCSDLSMGQLKRLALAKWLLDDHELYLIDEPFASLDQEGIFLVASIIQKLNSKGCSFLFTSHTSSNINSKEILLDKYS